MKRWSCGLQLQENQVRLLVQDPYLGALLKATLPLQSQHPRALLTLLEGLALYQGARLNAVISVASNYQTSRWVGLLGDELWPAESQLVRFDVVVPGRRKHRMGLGDFRSLRRQLEDS